MISPRGSPTSPQALAPMRLWQPAAYATAMPVKLSTCSCTTKCQLRYPPPLPPTSPQAPAPMCLWQPAAYVSPMPAMLSTCFCTVQCQLRHCPMKCVCVCWQVLLLDELTTFLDSSDQDSVLKAVRGIVDAQGPTPVTALWVRCYLFAC